MKTYRLPKALGAGEARYVADGDAAGCIIVELIDAAPRLRIEIDREHLTEVPPPAPPPPGFYLGTHTKVAGHAVLERDGDDWYVGGAYGTVPWGAVRDSYNSLVRLVPAPEPVELPWRIEDPDGDVVTVKLLVDTHRAGRRAYVHSTRDGAYLNADQFRDLARAATSAAAALDAVEAQS